ncbi:MAG: hypothetical protein J0H01_28385 [Rhizobiales bacterium]|nr:hypothetical protein [Hyphomicrobiales bacterium]
MRELRMVAAWIVVAASGIASAAQADPMTSDEIRQDIIGRNIFLAAPLGGEFPLNYRRSGRVDGNGQALGLGRVMQPRDSGRWWIANNRLCQQFHTWYDGTPMCFALTRTGGSSLKWLRDNGESGTARIGAPIGD